MFTSRTSCGGRSGLMRFLYVSGLMTFHVIAVYMQLEVCNKQTHSHVSISLHSLQREDEGDFSSLTHLLLSVP